MCLGHIHPHCSILFLSHFHWSSPSFQSYRSVFEGLFTRVWATDSGYIIEEKDSLSVAITCLNVLKKVCGLMSPFPLHDRVMRGPILCK